MNGLSRVLLIAAMLVPLTANALYRCKDEKGLTHIGHAPPPECANVPIYEVTATGTVLRKIDPTPTPEQLKAKQAEDAKAKEAAKAATEAQRRDKILLTTYNSEQDFDRALDIAMQPLNKQIEGNTTRLKAIEKREKEINDEMEFYKAGSSKSKAGSKGREPPAQLTNDLEILKKEKETLAQSNAKAEKDKEALRQRLEADKARWHELRQPKK